MRTKLFTIDFLNPGRYNKNTYFAKHVGDAAQEFGNFCKTNLAALFPPIISLSRSCLMQNFAQALFMCVSVYFK